MTAEDRMGLVMMHATVSLDGYMADLGGSVDWMNGFPVAREDEEAVQSIVRQIGAVVFGVKEIQTVHDGEVPYGGSLGVPMFVMTHIAHEAIEKDGTTYTFVVDDVANAIASARQAAGDKTVSVLGGAVSRQCLERGLVDLIQLHVVPIILGEGISLLSGLSRPVRLERIDTSAFAAEVHLRYRVLDT
jgi:dihydrofolate reductase